MTEIELTNYVFADLGFLMVDLPDDLHALLLKEADWIQNNFDKAIPRNKTLAGHIIHEYELTESAAALEKFILELTMIYDKKYNNLTLVDMLTKDVPLCLPHPWINFQQKHEFNPVHNHKGVMSFVCWLKIPYDLETEHREGPGRLRDATLRYQALNSCFQFLYVGNTGQVATHTIPVDKSYEGKLMIFPAKLMHTVYPFYTSDDYRISISGNVMLKTD
jgi:hypothetical protein